MTWACRVVVDAPDLLALYLPKGTPHKRWRSSPSGRELADSEWWHDVLRLMFPGHAHSVWVMWRPEDRGFDGYYVNLEEPFRRTTIGFDTNDHLLDIVVTPELRWSWKDEGVFVGALAEGVYSQGFGDEVRAEAARVIAAIESRSSPFCDGWERYQADPHWTTPELPDSWRSEPPALWERRHWAYPRAAERALSEAP